MIKIADGDANFLLADSITIEDNDIVPVDVPTRGLLSATSINELGKQLLKSSGDGDVDHIRLLMSKGAPFTADWLGTSPLHLAAQNNHLEVCEILLKAGISRDGRTKVDRTPLHIAAYEGHLDIVDCLLRHGADYDCRDMLHMTPLHWAAQNGHADVAALLIRHGAATRVASKFNLTAGDVAMQADRLDIYEIIRMSVRDPIVATQHLQLEMTGDSNDAADPVLAHDMEIPIQTVLSEDVDSDNSIDPDKIPQARDIPVESLVENEDPAMKYLQEHGITMLPNDDTNILSAVMETGHSVVLTDVGKQVLNSIKPSDTTPVITKTTASSQAHKPARNSANNPVNIKKVITLTPAEFVAMTNSGQLSKQLSGRTVPVPKHTIKRIMMKKNSRVFPVAASGPVNKVHAVSDSNSNSNSIESVKRQLADALRTIEEYKVRLRRKEAEVERYKMQLKMVLEGN